MKVYSFSTYRGERNTEMLGHLHRVAEPGSELRQLNKATKQQPFVFKSAYGWTSNAKFEMNSSGRALFMFGFVGSGGKGSFFL